MQIFRFMSKTEFEKYQDGEILINTTKHKGQTLSQGFCFFDIEDYKPEEACHFLMGIATLEYCVIFKTKKSNLFTSKAKYAKLIDPLKTNEQMFKEILSNTIPSFIATEYCTTKYSKENFKLIKYAKDIYKQYNILASQRDFIWQS